MSKTALTYGDKCYLTLLERWVRFDRLDAHDERYAYLLDAADGSPLPGVWPVSELLTPAAAAQSALAEGRRFLAAMDALRRN